MIDDHLGVLVCHHVFDRRRAVLLVACKGGRYQFLCGEGHGPRAKPPRIVGVGHLWDHDATLARLMADTLDRKGDWFAERKTLAGAWTITKKIKK